MRPAASACSRPWRRGCGTVGARHCPPLTRDMRRLIASGLLVLRRVRAFGAPNLRRNRLFLTDGGDAALRGGSVNASGRRPAGRG